MKHGEIDIENSIEEPDDLVEVVTDAPHPISESIDSHDIKHAELVSYQQAFPIKIGTKDTIEPKKLEKIDKIQHDGYVEPVRSTQESVFKIKHNLTDEAAKAFSLRINVALQYAANLEILPLPSEAPEKFISIKENGENPIEFINRVWGEYIKAGVLFKDQLNELDKNLLPAIRTFCKNNKIQNPDQFMPDGISVRQQHLLLLEPLESPVAEDLIIKAAERIKSKRRKAPNLE